MLSIALEATPPHPVEDWKATAPAFWATLYNLGALVVPLALVAEGRNDTITAWEFVGWVFKWHTDCICSEQQDHTYFKYQGG